MTRHTTNVYRQRRNAPPHQRDGGTVKSIERERGTGSIAPDRDARVTADTGFTRDVVGEETISRLRVGDRVQFNAVPDPNRPGYADAQVVEVEEPTA